MVDSHDHTGLNRRSVLKTIGAGALGAGVIATSGTTVADESSTHYHNPVGPVGFGDVTVIQAGDGTYYAYGTETPEDIVPIATSDDLVDWTYIDSAFDSYPDWRDDPDAGVWAPDINYYNGQYYLYYSYSTWGSQDNPGIGVALSDTPDGPFEDQGPVFRAEDLGMTNCIDSEFRVVDGTPYMIWGSFYGFYGVELTSDGMDYVPDTTFHLAGDNREGPMVIEENGYYYLFYSTGHCCEGYDSTYEVEVGRSESFFGPYYNQNGTDLRDLNEHRSGVSVLNGTDEFTGPGHNTAIQDENGDWWMLYHVEATADQETRIMMIDRIQWENGWPVVACDGTPSTQSPMPNTGSYDCGAVTSGIGISEGTYAITNVNSGKRLEVASAGTSDGDNVQQYSDTGHACQQWDVIETDDHETFHLRNVNSGKLMEVAGADTSDGATVQQYADTGHATQDWHIVDNGDGTYRIENANSGKVAEVNGASTDDGADVIQWSWNGGANQRWTFDLV
ncbi:glycoside hydrolase family 43 (plasmid) [Haloterrigena turkmenica DSM 5511]|uniref:Glycoside hydrolase family 43 n=1 Tax=Haloterrigena turkmenica (strain ATCC 51198 / DSM 5511 / JCM 9101 / NCIMB 13204 / VKM B-1734 / 4k) TaxID=543526 RepID=D2S1R0_HALTV|nr:RICIN domain-containing protein [Haloterrigena turkmenica]ADB63307.1 glycoside hydrolase family 43 [Haloterrigena turkmenica DSM 5511]